MIIAIDGPTASGKGTLARRLSAHYGLALLDTGAIYRAVALGVLEANGDPDDAANAEAAAKALRIETLDDDRLRTAEIGQAASKVSVHPGVRAALLEFQRAFARQPGGAILDGRDIGTVICPDADVKLFVVASAEARAQRRWRELNARGENISLETVTAAIAERDARDTSRTDAPLKPAADAHLLDTSLLSIDAAVEAACRIVDAALA
jgi:CMP/dCMP kinase